MHKEIPLSLFFSIFLDRVIGTVCEHYAGPFRPRLRVFRAVEFLVSYTKT